MAYLDSFNYAKKTIDWKSNLLTFIGVTIMKIRLAMIAVIVCLLLNLTVAEATTTQNREHKNNHHWHEVLHRLWHNQLQNLHNLHHHIVHKVIIPTGSTLATVAYNIRDDFISPTPSYSSHNTGSFMSEVSHDIHQSFKAPEISVASGASAIAFLAGVLLLVGEKNRAPRS